MFWKTLVAKISIAVLSLETLMTAFKLCLAIFIPTMYLLLFVITAISTAIANPLPADEAHREKPLKFSLSKDVRPSTYRQSAYRDQNVPDASSYGTILNEHQIPSGITSKYSVGDLHLPLQATKALDSVIGNGRKEMDLDVPEEAFTDQELLYAWKKPQDEAQPSSECGKSKSVCCMTSFKWGGSVVKACGNLISLCRA